MMVVARCCKLNLLPLCNLTLTLTTIVPNYKILVLLQHQVSSQRVVSKYM